MKKQSRQQPRPTPGAHPAPPTTYEKIMLALLNKMGGGDSVSADILGSRDTREVPFAPPRQHPQVPPSGKVQRSRASPREARISASGGGDGSDGRGIERGTGKAHPSSLSSARGKPTSSPHLQSKHPHDSYAYASQAHRSPSLATTEALTSYGSLLSASSLGLASALPSQQALGQGLGLGLSAGLETALDQLHSVVRINLNRKPNSNPHSLRRASCRPQANPPPPRHTFLPPPPRHYPYPPLSRANPPLTLPLPLLITRILPSLVQTRRCTGDGHG